MFFSFLKDGERSEWIFQMTQTRPEGLGGKYELKKSYLNIDLIWEHWRSAEQRTFKDVSRNDVDNSRLNIHERKKNRKQRHFQNISSHIAHHPHSPISIRDEKKGMKLKI